MFKVLICLPAILFAPNANAQEYFNGPINVVIINNAGSMSTSYSSVVDNLAACRIFINELEQTQYLAKCVSHNGHTLYKQECGKITPFDSKVTCNHWEFKQ